MKKLNLANYPDLWAYLFLAYATAVLLFPIIFAREGSFFVKQDNLHQAYPFFNKLAIALHKGYLPVWDANTYGGKNFAGEMQPGIFYPINILWCLLFGSVNGIDTYHLDLLMALHFLICAIGMYKVARMLRLSPVASIVSALIFSFSGAVGARASAQTCIFCGLALMPWSIFFTFKYYLVRKSRWLLAIAGGIAGLELLAGHIQPFFHTALITGIIILFHEYKSRKDLAGLFTTAALNFLLFVVAAFIIALPQLFYAAEYLSRCYRAVSGGLYIGSGQKVPLFIYGHWHIIQFQNLLNLFVQSYAQPDDDNTLYMGLLPVVLIVACMVLRKNEGYTKDFGDLRKLLAIILALGILSILGYVTWFYLILYEIPFVNAVRQLGRYLILISFSGSLLAGLAISNIDKIAAWMPPIRAKFGTIVLSAVGLNALYLFFFEQKYVPAAVSIPLLLVALFILALPTLKPPYISIGVLIVIFIDLLLNPVSYSSTKTPFYPDYFFARNKLVDTLERTYGKYRVTFDMNDYSLVRRNLGAVYSIQTKWGYGATVNKAYGDFTKMDRIATPEMDDLLNIRYVLTDKILDSNYLFREASGRIRLYERRTWYPRCYWKRQLGEAGPQIERENAGLIKQLAYSDNDEKLTVKCNTADTLIFSENNYPGWHCYDNGKNIPILTIALKNYPPLFRGIVLNPGMHLIEFRYNKKFYWF